MNRILVVHEADLDCEVEPGVTRKQLNDHLRDQGLFFPVDPGADAILGGMAATRASGTNAVRYGTMRDAVLGLSAVLADGSVIHTGGRARKSSAGYDLTRLLVGSEGTLGIITRADAQAARHSRDHSRRGLSLRIDRGRLQRHHRRACRWGFRSPASNCSTRCRSEPAMPIRISRCLRRRPCFSSFTARQLRRASRSKPSPRLPAPKGEGTTLAPSGPRSGPELWQARHDAYWAARGLKPGAEVLSTDVCVPISALAACVTATHADIDRLGLLAPIVGHVGDGNFHVMPLIDPADPEERRKVQGFLDRLVERALAYGRHLAPASMA